MTPSSSTGAARPPALLCDATWYGTLAAVRDLGSRGVPVTLASDLELAPARWSRYVTERVSCPPTKHPDFLRWLLDFGDRRPGHVLYPTSDDLAWLIVQHADELASRFVLYSPSLETMATLLDKGRCAEAARLAGVPVPEMWLPADEDEVARIAETARFPLLVKPRSQVSEAIPSKGQRVDRAEELLATWSALAPRTGRSGGGSIGSAELPLIQRCCEGEEIFTVDGFIDRGGEMVVLGCTKFLQVPRRKGAGIVFEEAPVPAEVSDGLRRLFLRVGFAGVFDAEFVTDGGSPLLIDVNPRFYNHMAFEIERGMPLAWLAYLAAVGDEEELHAVMRTPPGRTTPSRRVYLHGVPMALLLFFQRLSGNMTSEEAQRWRTAGHGSVVTDPVRDDHDWGPGLADVVYHLYQFLRHPRSFLRRYVSGAGLPNPGTAHSGATKLAVADGSRRRAP